MLRFIITFLIAIASNINVHVTPTVARCQTNCKNVNGARLVGPTSPSHTRPHPWKIAEMPIKFPGFCQLGCQFFYAEEPYNVTCKRACDYAYRYEVTVKYNDYIEGARLECRDGCDIALQICQTGYYCDMGKMLPCAPGRFRESYTENVTTCIDCPVGRYRERDKGTDADTCSLCPVGKYNNVTGADSIDYCIRCAAGMVAEEEGMGLCKCITAESCGMIGPEIDGNTSTYYSNGVDFFRETVPYVGRW
jgi:hypothetical protein